MTSDARSALRVVEVRDSADLNRFIEVPIVLHRGRPNFVPPLIVERREVLSPKHNPWFQHGEMALFLALRGDQVVGRISAQIDRLYLAKWGEGIGQFGFLDAIDDAAVFGALLTTAENWLRSRGMHRVLGPFNPTINEEPGILIEGFDTPPMMMMGQAEPYYARHVEAAGFAKARDLLAYLYDTATPPPPIVDRLLAKAGSERIRMRQIRKADYAREVRLVFDIFNDAWSDNWSSVAVTDAEVVATAKSMKPIVDPRLVWIAEVDGKAAGMVVVLPDVNAAIADLDGRLLPFGWLKLLWRLKVRGLDRARVPLMGIRKEYASGSAIGAALPFLLIDAMRRAAIDAGIRQGELSWILEDNLPVRRVIEAFGGKVYKTYRIFEKSLD